MSVWVERDTGVIVAMYARKQPGTAEEKVTPLTYSIAGDMPGGAVNTITLEEEVRASAITENLFSIWADGDVLYLLFDTLPLPSGDQTILDNDTTDPAGGLLAAHDNTATVPMVALNLDGSSQMTGPLQILDVAGAAYSRLGTNATGHGLAAADDLLISGILEVDGNVFFDSLGGAQWADTSPGTYGTGSDLLMQWNILQTNDAFSFGISGSNTFLFIEKTDRSFDFEHPDQATPTLFIHSDNQATDEWLGLFHDGSHGKVQSGKGDLFLLPKTNVIRLLDAVEMNYGSVKDSSMFWSTAQTNDALIIGVGAGSNALLITQKADDGINFGHANQTNPTIIIQSADATSTEQHAMIAHDQSRVVFTSGFGGYVFGIDDYAGAPGLTGSGIDVPTLVFTDDDTAESGTAVDWAGIAFQAPTLAAANASVTTTNAATVFINGAPIVGTNQTVTNNQALRVVGGAQFSGAGTFKVSQNAVLSGAVTFFGQVTMADNKNIALNTANGTKIGTAVGQKLGFWGTTPVVQESHIADATDAADVITQLNALLLSLETIGVLASA